MAGKIRIKDIAEIARVSPGTVDRVLHNRGNVSAGARQAVEKALAILGYKPNIHISAISLRKHFSVVIIIPQFAGGEYWDIIQKGIVRGIEELDSIDIRYEFLLYDQFDIYSCREAFRKMMSTTADGVIIGPTFREETVALAKWLDEKKIPYTFVDSMIEGTSPTAYFSSDHYKCGYLAGKLISSICAPSPRIALMEAVSVGNASANTAMLRKAGFMAYMEQHSPGGTVSSVLFSVMEPKKNGELIGNFFEAHPDVNGALVLNSRAHIIADYLEKRGNEQIKLVGIDLTGGNVEAIKSGRIDFVIGQRPEQQGFLALQALIQFLVYGQKAKADNYLPLDILTRENIDYYTEFL